MDLSDAMHKPFHYPSQPFRSTEGKDTKHKQWSKRQGRGEAEEKDIKEREAVSLIKKTVPHLSTELHTLSIDISLREL
ncbi:hypothetical protein Tco_0078000 [Tanacetum coccineum]